MECPYSRCTGKCVHVEFEKIYVSFSIHHDMSFSIHSHACKTFKKFTCCKQNKVSQHFTSGLLARNVTKDMFKAIINRSGEALLSLTKFCHSI